MAFTIVQTAPSVSLASLTGPITATFGSPTTAGNTLVACIDTQGSSVNPVVSTVKIGGAADHWAAVVTQNPGVTFGGAIWYDPNCAGGQTAVAVTFISGSGTPDMLLLTVYEVAGILTADKSASNTGTSTTTFTSTATATTINSTEIAFGNCMFGTAAAGTVTGAGTWTTQSQTTGVFSQVAGYQQLSATGTVTFSGTMSSGNYGCTVATFYAASTTWAAAATAPDTSAASGSFLPAPLAGTAASTSAASGAFLPAAETATAHGTSSASGAFLPAPLTGTAYGTSGATGAFSGPQTWSIAATAASASASSFSLITDIDAVTGSCPDTSAASGAFLPALLTATCPDSSLASGVLIWTITSAAAAVSYAAGFFTSAVLPASPVRPPAWSYPSYLSDAPLADPPGVPVPYPNGIVFLNSGGTAFRFVNTDGLPQVFAFIPGFLTANGDPIAYTVYTVPALSTVWAGAHDVPHHGQFAWIVASSPSVLVTAFEP